MAMDPQSLIRDHGLMAVFLVIILEQFGVPLPSMLVLIVAGAAAVADPWFGIISLLLTVLASVSGGVVLFALGRRRGDALLSLLCRISLSPHKCISHGRVAYQRFGSRALIMARFLPGLSALAPPLAGSIGMPFKAFVTNQSIAALSFALFGLALGYVFNDSVAVLVGQLQRHADTIAYALLAAFVSWLLYVRIVKRTQ